MNNIMSERDVMASIREVIAQALRVPASDIYPDTNLIVDLDAESIDIVDIRFRIEEKFGLRISQEAFIRRVAGGNAMAMQEKLTVANIVRFIMEERAEAGAP